MFILTSVPEVIAGIGLLKRRSWARILAIILAIPDLIQIPIGTAIGIYALWVLLNSETAQLFAHASARRKSRHNTSSLAIDVKTIDKEMKTLI